MYARNLILACAVLLWGSLAVAEFRLVERKDKVILTDGTVIEGIVVIEALRGVKILVVKVNENEQSADEEGDEKTSGSETASQPPEKPTAKGARPGKEGKEDKEKEAGEEESQPEIKLEERFIKRENILRVVRGRRLGAKFEYYRTEIINGMRVVVAKSSRPPADEALGSADSSGKRALPQKIPGKIDQIKPEHLQALAKSSREVAAFIALNGGDAAKALDAIKKNPQLRGVVETWLKVNAGKSTQDAMKNLRRRQGKKSGGKKSRPAQKKI